MNKLFVYGTLKYIQFTDEEKKDYEGWKVVSGQARTKPEYDLLSFTEFPAVFEGGASKVEGALLEVDDTALSVCDRIESEGKFYHRKKIRLEKPSVDAYIYVCGSEHKAFAAEDRSIVDLGDETKVWIPWGIRSFLGEEKQP